MGILRKRSRGKVASRHHLLQRAAASSSSFARTELLDNYAVLRWDTSYGGVGLAFALQDGNGSARQAAQALARRHGKHLGKVYASVAVGRAAWNLTSPELHACDISPDGRWGETYEPSWEQLATVLGTKAPYWHPALRDRDALEAWRPGAPPAQVPACHVSNPTAALSELAAADPDGSPAAAVCWWLAREIRRRDHAYARRTIDQIRHEADEDGDSAHLELGATPAPYLRDEDGESELPEAVRRAGWLAITARRDVLAHRAAQAVWRFDGGDDWHVGEMVELHPDKCETAREWAARLQPIVTREAPTVLEREVMETAGSTSLLLDSQTELPVARRAGTDGDEDDPDGFFTVVPQRLPTIGQLEAVILSDHVVWVRTAADSDSSGLWLAPHRPGAGLSWGYNGGGPHALAQLLDRLLEDITAPAVDHGGPPPPPGLLQLITSAPQDKPVTYNRAQLLAARAA